MRKLLVVLLAFVLSLGALAGCSCGGDDDGRIKLLVNVNSDTAENRLMAKWKEEYEKAHPELNIVIKSISDNYSQDMQTYQKAKDTAPDIIWTTGEMHAPWSQSGLFVNLKDRIDNDSGDNEINPDNFYEEMIKCTHKDATDNGIYFIPRDYNKCVIFINKKVFKDCGFTDDEIAGLKDGWNYAKFLEVCERLRTAMNGLTEYGDKEDAVPLEARIGFNASYMSFMKHFGGNPAATDGDNNIDYYNASNLKAYGKIYDLVDKGYIAEQSTMDGLLFNYKRAAMKIDVRPSLPTVPNTADYDIDFLPLPLDFVGVGCSGYAISKYAKDRVSKSEFNTEQLSNEEYAYRFLQYIVSEEGQKVGANMGSIVPVLKSLANDPSWTAYKSADLNHAAFVSNPEKDFNLNVYNGFDPRVSAKILTNMSKVILCAVKEQNFPQGVNADGTTPDSWAELRKDIGSNIS